MRESQLDYLAQVDRLRSYMNQSKVLLSELSQQRKLHERVEVALQQVLHFQKANPMPPPGTIKLGKDDLID